MIQKQIIAKLIVCILFCFPVILTRAQQNKVDSIVHLLQKSKLTKDSTPSLLMIPVN